jgi:hypothetical protein
MSLASVRRFGAGRRAGPILGRGTAAAKIWRLDHKLKYGSAQPRRHPDQPADNGASASTALPFRTSAIRLSQTPAKEIRNEYLRRIVRLPRTVRVPCSGAGLGRDGPALAPAHDLVARSVSAGAALHAWPRSKMASQACARCRVRELTVPSRQRVNRGAHGDEPWPSPNTLPICLAPSWR